MRINLVCFLLVLLAFTLPARADIVEAEYYINTDPGQGNGTPITIVGDGSSLDVEVDPALIAALPFGFHRLAVRVRNDLGEWSNAELRAFAKTDPNEALITFPNSTITAAEYFINSDPGQGNGTPIALTGDGSSLDIEVNPALIAPLPDGFHILAVRLQNALGFWSDPEFRPFSKNPSEIPEPSVNPIMAALEYQWFQNNTAVTEPVTINVTSASKSYSFQELASLAGLNEGDSYQILFTPIDSEGQRGFGETRTVEIQTTDSDGDGVPDLWENTFGFNPNDASDLLAGSDQDNDGVSDKEEFLGGSNPTLEDSDGDGISDRVEINLAALGLDPAVDNPGLTTLVNGTLTDGLRLEDIRRLKPSAPLLLPDPTTGKIILTMEWQQSGDLSGGFERLPLSVDNLFVTEDGKLEVEVIPDPEDTRGFYRLELLE